MSNSLFLQLHALRSHTNVLLNRNDIGEPKTCRVGGVRRTRVSSQCRKWHWRQYEGPHAIRDAGDMSVRSRHTFFQLIAKPLLDEGYDPRHVAAVVAALKGVVMDDTTTKKKIQGEVAGALKTFDDEENNDEENNDFALLKTEQVVVLGKPETDYLKDLAGRVLEDLAGDDLEDEIYAILKDRDLKSNLRALANAAGIDAGMFGRMSTSDTLAQGDAAVHVAHAYTTHEHLQDSDYFATTDDFDDVGSGHINQKELTSGTFYEYAVVDIPLLVSNLEGCARDEWREQDMTLTRDVLRRFMYTYAQLSPGAKKSSTAPHSVADFFLAEVGDFQPHSVSFDDPVSFDDSVVVSSARRIDDVLQGVDRMYEPGNQRAYASTLDLEFESAEAMTLPDLATFVEDHALS